MDCQECEAVCLAPGGEDQISYELRIQWNASVIKKYVFGYSALNFKLSFLYLPAFFFLNFALVLQAFYVQCLYLYTVPRLP